MFSWTKPALYHAQEKGTYVSGLKITTCGNWSNKEDTRLCACGIRRDSKLGKTHRVADRNVLIWISKNVCWS